MHFKFPHILSHTIVTLKQQYVMYSTALMQPWRKAIQCLWINASDAGLVKYVWPFRWHQALKGWHFACISNDSRHIFYVLLDLTAESAVIFSIEKVNRYLMHLILMPELIPHSCLCFKIFIFPSRVGRTRALCSKYIIDRANFTDWMYFLPSNLMKEISANSFSSNLLSIPSYTLRYNRPSNGMK